MSSPRLALAGGSSLQIRAGWKSFFEIAPLVGAQNFPGAVRPMDEEIAGGGLPGTHFFTKKRRFPVIGPDRRAIGFYKQVGGIARPVRDGPPAKISFPLGKRLRNFNGFL